MISRYEVLKAAVAVFEEGGSVTVTAGRKVIALKPEGAAFKAWEFTELEKLEFPDQEFVLKMIAQMGTDTVQRCLQERGERFLQSIHTMQQLMPAPNGPGCKVIPWPPRR